MKYEYLYAIGGKGENIALKTIEVYDIEDDSWSQIKMQLNYERAFGSAVTFQDRYIYVIGGSSTTDCVEKIDTLKVNEKFKAELILL